MVKPKITGNVVANWKRHANGRKTVVFACTIDHAKRICDEFNSAGIRFRHVDQETGDSEREEIFGLIRDGHIIGFTNVSVARRGLDLPCLECACVVRPTRSLVLWLQMIGRIRRPSPGKTDCIVIDHAGACDAHCMPDDEIAWNLDSTKKIGDWVQEQKGDGKLPKTIVCPECSCMFTGSRCPNCGYTLKERPKHTREVEHANGILVEREGKRETISLEEMQRQWNKAIAIAVNRHQMLGAAVHIFNEKTGKSPWEVPDLQKLPPPGDVWRQRAEDIFPNFLRVKVRG
jgi:superfamily II DNA or RNA helicase